MPFGRYVTLIRFSLQLLLRPYPRLSFLFIVLIVLQGVIPSFSVIASIRLGNLVGHGSPNQLLIACLVWAFTLILPEMIAPLISTLQSVLNQKATQLTQHKIMSAVARIDDLQVVEGPSLHDSLQMLSKEAAYRPLNLLVNLVDICRGSVTLLSLALVLASVVWWLPLALLLPAIPVAVSVARSQLDVFRTMLGEGKTARLIGYYFSVIVDVKLVKEIKLFGLADFFIAKHHAAFAEMDGVLQQVRKNQFLRPQKWNLLYMISAMGIMLWFSDYLVSGKISTGGLLGTIQSISLFSLSCQWMVYSFGNLRVCLAFFDKLQALEEAAAVRGTSANRPLPTDCTLCFENVSFAWPDNKPVLHNLNLRINAGEHVAIVGENGAGKSTLIKLLCRLYKPDSGRITLGGVDISQIDRHAWHSRISAVFQDFGRYNLTLAENIVLGDIGSIPSDERIRAASQKAQFSLPAGMAVSSQIGKEFGGTELSGGEWQRLALARAFYADRPLVILDEPTSAMDPRVEAELFSQFGHIMAGKTAVMVTHRLGSVRSVDRVVVMKAGRIVEEGPPQVLEALNGEYAELLALQKNQYADRPASRE